MINKLVINFVSRQFWPYSPACGGINMVWWRYTTKILPHIILHIGTNFHSTWNIHSCDHCMGAYKLCGSLLSVKLWCDLRLNVKFQSTPHSYMRWLVPALNCIHCLVESEERNFFSLWFIPTAYANFVENVSNCHLFITEDFVNWKS